jgi:hypothetical protein
MIADRLLFICDVLILLSRIISAFTFRGTTATIRAAVQYQLIMQRNAYIILTFQMEQQSCK